MIKKPNKKAKIRKEKIALMESQITDLLRTIKEENKKHSQRNYVMAKTWLLTGFRVSEICNFVVDWIEEGGDSDFIHIRENKAPFSFRPKYGSTRRIAIPKNTTKMLKKHLAGRKTGYLFVSQKKGRLHTKYVIGMFDRYFEQTKSIGRKLGSHTFRRTFASQLATSKPPVPIPQISTYLGHKNLKTTIGYLMQIKNDDHTSLLSSDYIKNLENR